MGGTRAGGQAPPPLLSRALQPFASLLEVRLGKSGGGAWPPALPLVGVFQSLRLGKSGGGAWLPALPFAKVGHWGWSVF